MISVRPRSTLVLGTRTRTFVLTWHVVGTLLAPQGCLSVPQMIGAPEIVPFRDPASPGRQHVLSSVSTPQSLGSTVVSTPRRNAEAAVETPGSDVRETAPPTPQGPRTEVGRDPNHPWAGSPSRTQPPTTATPSDEDKKSGARSTHPINFI